MTETGMALSELSYARRHLKKWVRTRNVISPLTQFHASSFVVPEPYGVVLVMSPWNYPFMLCIEPLIGAISGGNCCILKPSGYSPATSAVIYDIVHENFASEYITVVQGGRKKSVHRQ